MTQPQMRPVSVASVPTLAREYREFMRQFNDMFVGREQELRLMTYALIQREHVLLSGPPGTSKTALSDSVFSGITNAATFATEFSKFMSDDAVYGAYDVKAMREEGKLIHRTEGMLPEAQLARLGEFLDANESVLRSILGILNERRMIRGAQIMQTPLMTVYCDTNIDPGEYIRRNPNAWAVLDRILFLGSLGYIEEGDQLGEMVSRFQRGMLRKPRITIDVSVIEQLSSLIVTPPGLITDRTIIDTYGRAVDEYRKERRKLPKEAIAKFILPDISDRRAVRASQMLEANAVLQGRVSVIPDDIMAAGVVLCTTPPEHDLWKQISEKHIGEHKRRDAAQLKNSQGLALKGIEEQLELQVFNASNGNSAQALQVLLQQFHSIAPTDPEIEKLYAHLKGRFAEAIKLEQQRALDAKGLNITP